MEKEITGSLTMASKVKDIVNRHTTAIKNVKELTFSVASSGVNAVLNWEERNYGGATLSIFTATGGGGTQLIPNTDYILTNLNASLTAETGVNVYNGLSIINATYHDVSLYVPVNTVDLYGDFVNNSDINDLQAQINEILAGTAQAIVGQEVYFPYFADLSQYGLLAFNFNNAVLKSVYPSLYTKVGDSFEQQHLDAGDPASGASYFYPTPVPGGFGRAGLPDVIFTDSDVSGNVLQYSFYTAFRDGTAFKYKVISGTTVTNLVNNTVYYLRKVSSTTAFYPTEKDAIEDTNQILISGGSGEFRLTQAGLAVNPTMQGFRATVWADVDTVVNNQNPSNRNFGFGTGSLYIDASGGGVNGAMLPGNVRGPITDGVNGTVNISNEPRPLTYYRFAYIKAEDLTPAGEPVSALRYDTGWLVNTDWTAKDFIVNLPEELQTTLDQLRVRVLFSSNGVDLNAKLPLGMAIRDAGISEQPSLVVTQPSIASLKVSTGASGVRIGLGDGTGGSLLLAAQSYYIRIIVEKPQLTATFGYTPIRKVCNITDATDITYTLPDAANFYTEVIIKRLGAGTGKVLFASTGGQTVDGNTPSTYELEDGVKDIFVVFPDGGNWFIKTYELST
jgi:hypothetical protein